MSTLQFWLSYNNGAERLRLPVNPERISVSSSHGYEDVDVTGLGEYTVVGNDKLREYSFTSFFPRDYNSSYCEYVEIPDPWEAVATIERWMKSRRPIRLTITGTPINAAVTIREFNYYEEGGHVGDVNFDITLKEYVFIEFTRLKAAPKTALAGVMYTSETERPDNRETPTSHTVSTSDSLWKIAQKLYGDGDRWREIYEANTDIIGPNPNLIKPGQTLVIP